jgi:hypothetical protein
MTTKKRRVRIHHAPGGCTLMDLAQIGLWLAMSVVAKYLFIGG